MTRSEVERMLGQGAFKLWAELPRDIQELLFETAAPALDSSARTQMATILHDHHPKTAHPPKPTQLA